jgi:hypothetical protein
VISIGIAWISPMQGGVARAWAQAAEAPHTVGITWDVSTILVGAAVVLAVGVLIVLGVRALERRNRRDAQAVRVQEEVAALLVRDPSLRGVAVRPVVTPGPGRALRVELVGEVPSVEMHARVVRAVRRFIEEHHADAVFVDRVALRPRDARSARRRLA